MFGSQLIHKLYTIFNQDVIQTLNSYFEKLKLIVNLPNQWKYDLVTIFTFVWEINENKNKIHLFFIHFFSPLLLL
jgi:hypothetical protein